MLILVVEDDSGTRAILTRALAQAGYDVAEAADRACAFALFASASPDLVVLDVGLPDVDGFEVCRRIRRESRVPVVMLTARGAEEDVLRGYGLGVDDYVTKPVRPRIMAARVGTVLRRTTEGCQRGRERSVRLGGLEIDLPFHQVHLAGVPVDLTPTEFRLLVLLATNGGRVI